MKLAKGQCGRKKRYKSKMDAIIAGATHLRKEKGGVDTNQFRAYRCRCGWWHLTKQPFILKKRMRKGGGDECKSL